MLSLMRQLCPHLTRYCHPCRMFVFPGQLYLLSLVQSQRLHCQCRGTCPTTCLPPPSFNFGLFPHAFSVGSSKIYVVVIVDECFKIAQNETSSQKAVLCCDTPYLVPRCTQKLQDYEQCYFHFWYMVVSLCTALVNTENHSVDNMLSVGDLHNGDHTHVHRLKASSHIW